MVSSYFATILPKVPECFVGARRFTQVLDVAHGIQSVIEKGLDDFGAAACAQCDIQQYYDSLPIGLIFEWLVLNGLPGVLAAALVRLQLCPQVALHARAAKVDIGNRCLRGLAGSRVEGLLAHAG